MCITKYPCAWWCIQKAREVLLFCCATIYVRWPFRRTKLSFWPISLKPRFHSICSSLSYRTTCLSLEINCREQIHIWAILDIYWTIQVSSLSATASTESVTPSHLLQTPIMYASKLIFMMFHQFWEPRTTLQTSPKQEMLCPAVFL